MSLKNIACKLNLVAFTAIEDCLISRHGLDNILLLCMIGFRYSRTFFV